MKHFVLSILIAGLIPGLSALAGFDGWLTDFNQAKKAAVEKKMPILAVFAGTDWCGWCIKLDEEVFSQAEFTKYAKNNLVMFLADFPQTHELAPALTKQNQALAGAYGVEGFPTVLLLNADGKVLAKTGYRPGGPAQYVEHIKSLLKNP